MNTFGEIVLFLAALVIIWAASRLFVPFSTGTPKRRPYKRPQADKVDDCTVAVTGDFAWLAERMTVGTKEHRRDGSWLIHVERGQADAVARFVNEHK